MRMHIAMGAAPGVILLALLLFVPGLTQARDSTEVLATVNGRNITEADIAATIEAQMLRVNNQIYTIKKQALDALVSDHLIEQEAKKRGLSRAQLLQQEVNAKVAPVSDTEVEQIYNANKSRLGGKTLEELKPQLVQQLQSAKQQQQHQEFVQELRKAAKVQMQLKPPTVDVALDGAPVRGPATAAVTIVEFSDFQ